MGEGRRMWGTSESVRDAANTVGPTIPQLPLGATAPCGQASAAPPLQERCGHRAQQKSVEATKPRHLGGTRGRAL